MRHLSDGKKKGKVRMSTVQRVVRRYALPLLLFLVLAAVFYWAVHENWEKETVITSPVNRKAMIEDYESQTEARQPFQVAMDALETVSFDLYLQDLSQKGRINVSLLDEQGQTLRQTEKEYSDLLRDGMNEFRFDEPLMDSGGRTVTLRINTEGGIWLGYGDAFLSGKIEIGIPAENKVLVNGNEIDGCLVMRQTGTKELKAAAYFWPVTGILSCLFLVTALINDLMSRKAQTPLQKVRDVIHRYRYLLKQLVLRDFKVKYKASLLGFLWSFLNPLLMILVYYVVFSNLFSTQEHFVVYLMCGTILFSYVSESTSLGLNSIVGNADLITKVYIPKYIFPLSKALSSAINLLISMIPLMVLMMLDHLQFSKALVLIPVLVVLLILFCAGLSLILSSLMVFFRDTQFLWSVIILMWNFLSPVFYPESIIPASILDIYRMNPLYQYMSFLRNIALNGKAPGPQCFAYCSLAALISISVGLLVFRKLQNRFALYL